MDRQLMESSYQKDFRGLMPTANARQWAQDCQSSTLREKIRISSVFRFSLKTIDGSLKRVESSLSDIVQLIASLQTYVNFGYSWEGTWIGLSDRAKEGTFVWEKTGQKANYANWLPSEPDDYGQNEDFTIMLAMNGQWNDDSSLGAAPQTTMCEKLLPQSEILHFC